MDEREDPRLLLVLSVERIALVSRYLVFVIGVPLLLLGYLEWSFLDLIILTVVVGAHNVFSHWVFLTRRYYVFRTPLNFMLYLVEVSVLVGFTGAEESALYVTYLFLLAGYSAYSGRLTRTLLVTALCCQAFAVVLLLELVLVGITMPSGIIAAKFFSIVVFGWLVGRLGELRRRAEEGSLAQTQALAASEAALRTILDSTGDPIVVSDENECITDANDKACEFFRVPRDELLGQRLRRFIFDDGTLPNKMAMLRSQGGYHGELILVNAEGEERTVDFHARSSSRGDILFFVSVVHDITERKNLQEATRLANVNLERLNRELSQVSQLKTQFMATLSQELRSPLTAVLGFVEMMLHEELGEVTPEQRKALQTCRRSARRAFRLIDEALDFGHFDGSTPQTTSADPEPQTQTDPHTPA